MNQKTIVWGIVAVIIVALGVWYFSSMNTSPAAATQETTIATSTASTTVSTSSATSATSAPVPVAAKSAFKSIFTQSGNHECTYQQVGASTQTTSVIYISGGKMRGEFRTTGTITEADLMIYNGGYLYSWKEGATTGTRTSIKSLADLPQVIPQNLTSGAVFGSSADSVSWDCHSWLTDPSVFVLPAYVKFS